MLRVRADAAILTASGVHGAGLVAGLVAASSASSPAARVLVAVFIGAGMCWGSNTVAHIHLHAPLFSRPGANRAFSLYLALLLGVPQRWWKMRHLAHHGLHERAGLGVPGVVEMVVLAGFWTGFGLVAPELWAACYLPGWAFGLALCALQGHYEHAGGAFAVDHAGRLYNRLWFNDGYHTAHHRTPNAHWTALPSRSPTAGRAASPFPPLLRFLANTCPTFIDALERLALDVPGARRFLLATHRPAWQALLPESERKRIREVVVVGGGLFPRTAILLADLLPHARLTLLDAASVNLDLARRELDRYAVPCTRIRFVVGRHEATRSPACDLLVLPLAYRGDRDALYRTPPAPLVAVHDWIWRRRGDQGRRISWFLAKRLNLVRRVETQRRSAALARPGNG